MNPQTPSDLCPTLDLGLPTPERLAYLQSEEYLENFVRPWWVKARRAIDWLWRQIGAKSSYDVRKNVYSSRKTHPHLKDETFWAEAYREFEYVATHYDFALDERAETWKAYDFAYKFLMGELLPGFEAGSSVFGYQCKRPRRETWPTRTYFRYAQTKWETSFWEITPAWPDKLMSLLGFVLVTSARNMNALTAEEQDELLFCEWKHVRGIFEETENGTRPDSVKLRIGEEFLPRAPYCMYIPFVDVDAKREHDAFDEVESPKNAVAYAKRFHEEVAPLVFGTPKWKLSNKVGGLHGVNQILPPEVQSPYLTLAIAHFIVKKCAELGIPTVSPGDGEVKNRPTAEAVDVSPFHKKPNRRGGMYRTPGNYKTDDKGNKKEFSVAQEDVEIYAEELPWLAPLTTENLGPSRNDYSGLMALVASVLDDPTFGMSKQKERRLKPGEAVTRPRLMKPRVELGSTPFDETARTIKRAVVETNVMAKHALRLALAGALLRAGWLPSLVLSTLGAAFDNQDDVRAVVESTVATVRARGEVAGWSAVERLIGKEWTDKIHDAIESDTADRLNKEAAAGEIPEEVVQLEEVEPEEQAAAVSEDPEVATAIETAKLHEETDVAAHAEAKAAAIAKGEVVEEPVSDLLKVKPAKWFSAPGAFKNSEMALAGFIENGARADWNKVLYHFAGVVARAGVDSMTFQSIVSGARKIAKEKAKGKVFTSENAARLHDANYFKIKANLSGVGGIYGLDMALRGDPKNVFTGTRRARLAMDAFVHDLENTYAPAAVKKATTIGQRLTHTEYVFVKGMVEDAHFFPGRLEFEGKVLDKIKRMAECGRYGARGVCLAPGHPHGESTYTPFVCQTDACRSCRRNRERARRNVMLENWQEGSYLVYKIPMAEREEVPAAKGSIKGQQTCWVSQRVIVGWENVYKELPKHIPVVWAFASDHTIAIVRTDLPAVRSTGVDSPADVVRIADGVLIRGGNYPEECTRAEAIERFLQGRRSIGDGLDDLIAQRSKDILEYTWFDKGLRLDGANRPARKVMPLPSEKQLREQTKKHASEQRGFEVAPGTCPQPVEEVDANGTKVVRACGSVLASDLYDHHTDQTLVSRISGPSFRKSDVDRQVALQKERKTYVTYRLRPLEEYKRLAC